jgi:hypothetical protein
MTNLKSRLEKLEKEAGITGKIAPFVALFKDADGTLSVRPDCRFTVKEVLEMNAVGTLNIIHINIIRSRENEAKQ